MGNVFSASNLLEANFTKPTTTEKIHLEESYFVAALNYLEEMDSEMSVISKTLYKSILESENSVTAINESFSSFCTSIKNIIDKFIAFLKRIAQKFILDMNKIVKSDKYIVNHKANLKKFTPENNFEMNIFIFTHLNDDNIPLLDPEDDWKRSEGFASTNSTGALLTRATAVYNAQKDKINDGWYDSFRSRVIGSNKGSITSKEFGDELFELFRNGSKEKTKEEISSDAIIDALNRFEGYKANFDHVAKCKRNLEIGYTNIKNEVESWAKAGTDGKSGLNILFGDSADTLRTSQDYIDNKKEIDQQADLFVKSKVSQIDYMCKIHAMAFTAKLDAIKDCYHQDKTILYKALSKVTKVFKEEASIDEAQLTAKDRKELDDSDFGIPKLRKYPLIDEGHVRAAISYFDSVDKKYEEELAHNIIKKMDEFDMDVKIDPDSKFAKYYKSAQESSIEEEDETYGLFGI